MIVIIQAALKKYKFLRNFPWRFWMSVCNWESYIFLTSTESDLDNQMEISKFYSILSSAFVSLFSRRFYCLSLYSIRSSIFTSLDSSRFHHPRLGGLKLISDMKNHLLLKLSSPKDLRFQCLNSFFFIIKVIFIIT